jgi:hypothetical protein
MFLHYNLKYSYHHHICNDLKHYTEHTKFIGMFILAYTISQYQFKWFINTMKQKAKSRQSFIVFLLFSTGNNSLMKVDMFLIPII